MAQGHPRPPSTSSSDSDRYSSTHRSTRSGNSSSRRHVRMSDERLADAAAESERVIQWGEILRKSHDSHASGQWKWLETFGQFALYSKQESQRYAVLASGVLSCSVAEVVHLLHSPNGEKYLLNMEALYGDKFRDGAFSHHVDVRTLDEDGAKRHPDLLDLSVKTAMFGSHDKWCFLDASYRRQDGQGYEKISTTLDPACVEGNNLSESSNHHTNYMFNVTTAFSVQPEKQTELESNSTAAKPKTNETRVFFYAEFIQPHRRTGHSPDMPSTTQHDKAIKQRLFKMAKSCERLTELIRRRRLGVLELNEPKSSPFSANKCVCCNKSVMLLGVKYCRVCGQSVCSECSHKHERETQVPGSRRMLLEDVRVCDRCMDHVDRSAFPELDDATLLAPTVSLNRLHSRTSATPSTPAAPEKDVLQDLLKDQLLNASTKARQESVMNLLKCMMEQDKAKPTPTATSSSTSSSGSASSSSRRAGTILLE